MTDEEDKLLDFSALEEAAAATPNEDWKSVEVLMVDFESTGATGTSDGKGKAEKREWIYKLLKHPFWQMRILGKYWADTGVFNKQLRSIAT